MSARKPKIIICRPILKINTSSIINAKCPTMPDVKCRNMRKIPIKNPIPKINPPNIPKNLNGSKSR